MLFFSSCLCSPQFLLMGIYFFFRCSLAFFFSIRRISFSFSDINNFRANSPAYRTVDRQWKKKKYRNKWMRSFHTITELTIIIAQPTHRAHFCTTFKLIERHWRHNGLIAFGLYKRRRRGDLQQVIAGHNVIKRPKPNRWMVYSILYAILNAIVLYC